MPNMTTPFMVFEKLIWYIGMAVGLKPSARGCEARLRGLERMMYSKTISAFPRWEWECGSSPQRGGGWEGG